MRRTIALLCMLMGALNTAPAFSDVTMNGFATFGMGIASNDGGYLGYGKDFDLAPDSVVGVQLGYNINEKMSATVQLLARGSESWEPEMEWAYLSYHADNGNTYRAGRLRIPLYMYSDYLDVGYAQPFARPQTTMYKLLSYTAFTGVDAIIPVDLGHSILTFQPFFGGTTDTAPDGTPFTQSNMMGANITWEWDSLMLRAIYGQTEADTPSSNILIKNKDGIFTGLGLKYDEGSWFGVMEYGTVEVEDEYPDSEAMYVAMGYRIKEFTPYASIGYAESTDNTERLYSPLNSTPYAAVLPLLTYERTEYSLGVRWDAMENIALKADITLMDNFNGTAGILPGANNYMIPQENVSIYTITLDMVF